MSTGYLLIPQHRFSTQEYKGGWFQLGGRKNWTFTLRISSFPTAGSCTVTIEVSPVGLETDWRTLVSFGAQTARCTVVKRTPSDFVIDPYQETFVRAHITSLTGTVIVDVRAEAPFFDTTDADHTNMLSQELRDWKDGRDRTLVLAEDTVITDILADPATGRLDLDLSALGATEAVRTEIVQEAEHQKRREVLSRSSDPTALKSLKEMTRGVPGRAQRLRKFRIVESGVWKGR